jgi:hypothetical protein
MCPVANINLEISIVIAIFFIQQQGKTYLQNVMHFRKLFDRLRATR